MEINTIILILSSGFAGAIAGGVVSFISQYFNRKWNREDNLRELKIKLYGEIISMGSRYIGESAFNKLNNVAARVLLICDQEINQALVHYVANIESINGKLSSASEEEANSIISQTISENTLLHEELVTQMKNELGL